MSSPKPTMISSAFSLLALCSLAPCLVALDLSERPQVSTLSRTKRRAETPAVGAARPAIWGEPAPDFRGVNLMHTPVTYLYTLLFLDHRIVKHYDQDMAVARREVMKMINFSNEFFYQFNIRIVVVDILPTFRSDWSLYAFNDYHARLRKELPYHSFAALIIFRHHEGLAFIDRLCARENVMYSGFYPQNPEEMGVIFFHEVTHLFGIPHHSDNETLIVEHCNCSVESFAVPAELPENNNYGSCLRIPAYDHNCTAQLLANLIPKNRCLPRDPRSNAQNVAEGFVPWVIDHAADLAICGNGLVEAGEDCDCGPAARCDLRANCLPGLCMYRVSPYIYYLKAAGVVAVFALALLLVVCCLWRTFAGFPDLWNPLKRLSKLLRAKRTSSCSNTSRQAFLHQNKMSSSLTLGSSYICHTNRPKMAPPPPPTVKKATVVSVPVVPDTNDIAFKFAPFDDELSDCE